MNDKLNFAILGAGHIAAKMARTLNFLRDEVNPYAVASRDLSRAEAIRAESRFDRAYGSYAEMLADPAVDVVYVATPNSFHCQQMKDCLAAGKHVVLVAGKPPPPGASFKVGNERMTEDGLLEIEFSTVD